MTYFALATFLLGRSCGGLPKSLGFFCSSPIGGFCEASSCERVCPEFVGRVPVGGSLASLSLLSFLACLGRPARGRRWPCEPQRSGLPLPSPPLLAPTLEPQRCGDVARPRGPAGIAVPSPLCEQWHQRPAFALFATSSWLVRICSWAASASLATREPINYAAHEIIKICDWAG